RWRPREGGQTGLCALAEYLSRALPDHSRGRLCHMLVGPKFKELNGIPGDYFVFHVVGYSDEGLVHDLLGIWPVAFAVGEIGSPHDSVHSDLPVHLPKADWVVLEAP